MHVAPLHDRDECRRLSRPDRLIANGRLRADFLVHVDDGKPRVVHAPITLSDQYLLNVVSDTMKFLRANDKIEVRHFIEQRSSTTLGHATEKTENNLRPLFRHSAEHSHFAERLLIGHVPYAAGVQQNYIGI